MKTTITEITGKEVTGVIVTYSDNTIERFTVEKTSDPMKKKSIILFFGKPVDCNITDNDLDVLYRVDVRGNTTAGFVLSVLDGVVDILEKTECPVDIIIEALMSVNSFIEGLLKSRIRKILSDGGLREN